MPVLVREWESDEEFARERPNIHGVGASEGAAAIGLSRYQSALEWHLRKRGLMPQIDETEAMEMGKVLEPVVLQLFTKRTGLVVTRRKAMWAHDRYPWMLCNPDAETVEPTPALVEAKTGGAYTADAWADDAIPMEYQIQGAHQMAVMDRGVCYIPVLLGGQHVEIRKVVRDETVIANLIELEGAAWEAVQSGIAPEPDGSESAGKALLHLYRGEKGRAIALPASALELIEAYETARQAEADAKAAKEEAQQNLCALLGDAAIGTVGRRVVRWTPYGHTSVDVEALKAAKLYDRFARKTPTRRFGVA